MCTISGVTRCTLFMVLYMGRMGQCGLHAVLNFGSYGYTFAPPRSRTSQNPRTFIPLSVSLLNDLCDPVFDGVKLAGFKRRANVFLPGCSLPFCLLLFSLALLSFSGLVLRCWGLLTDMESLSSSIALPTFFNNNNNSNNNNNNTIEKFKQTLIFSSV